ncbi:hypothetical protein X772_32215 [Mesorhizobium sp. LSJC280B00]|nr:hypothetical protein X772_32215 [Mesorhizobium sp. LSJC280B00]
MYSLVILGLSLGSAAKTADTINEIGRTLEGCAGYE